MNSIPVLILAGGMGSRLKPVVSDIPKPMADINGKPFLSYLMDDLTAWGFKKFYISAGYKAEVIKEYYKFHERGISVKVIEEEEPLGTGGAIAYALSQIDAEQILVLNGDTLYRINYETFTSFYGHNNVDILVGLRKVSDVSRYGSIELDKDKNVVVFNEKGHSGSGLINGGIYLLDSNIFNKIDLAEKFSFEVDVLHANHENINIKGIAMDGYFIDIGIPEDYKKAQEDFKEMTF